MDGAGYFDIQELENGNLAFVESNKLTVRYHEISVDVLKVMKRHLDYPFSSVEEKNRQILFEDPVFAWNETNQDGVVSYRAPGKVI